MEHGSIWTMEMMLTFQEDCCSGNGQFEGFVIENITETKVKWTYNIIQELEGGDDFALVQGGRQ